MRGAIRVSIVLCALVASGCATSGQARYVYQDGQFGVIGIPENTSAWPTYYRAQADVLMQKHFPEGFEVVRAEEVEEGSRTLTVNGTNSAQLDTEGPVPLIKVGKIGRTATRTQADSVKIKECRIVYKKAGCTAIEPEFGFAEIASQTPEPYLDPNAEARRHIVAKPVTETTKVSEAAAKSSDRSHSETKDDSAQHSKGPARE
jgi:hypothetical protein